ncbi:MAG: family 2 encapsulin nanocompartment cargo protein terpene cyclase [Streptosporangiaceae bacterium]|jgi:2-methylisoborneol synthase
MNTTLFGPTGPGTSAARILEALRPSPPPAADENETQETRGGLRIPELYCPEPLRDDPALGEAVNEGLVAWAAEIGIYAGKLDKLRSHNFGRLMMLGHPDCDDPDRLLAAARCGLSEWSVDDHYVDIEGDDAEPELIGLRLALAHAVVDPVRLPPRYMADFEKVVASDPVLKAFRSCLAHLQRYASTTQVARLRHELAVMFVAYGQEAEWRAHKRRPPVWEYLLHRYENAFFPCMVLVDPIGGYELPPQEFANPAVRRVYLLAGVATVMLNDIYSMGVEDPTDTNLPQLIVEEENCSLQEAVDRSAQMHNEMMHTYETEAAILGASGSPELRRFFAGVWAWMGGAKRWHATSPRYQQA